MSESTVKQPERTFTSVGRNTFESSKGNKRVFVKTPAQWSGSSEHPHSQKWQYDRLKPFLRMPRSKIVEASGRIQSRILSSSDRLVVQPVDGQRYDQAIVNSPEQFSSSATAFITDLSRMWEQTKKPIEQIRASQPLVADLIVERMKDEPTNTIKTFLSDEATQGMLDLPLMINGREYPGIRKICREVLRSLDEQTDRVVTLGHGDEHFGNLFVTKDNGETSYAIIDPRRRTTRRSPAAAVNTFIGSFLLFVFEYNTHTNIVNDSAQQNSLVIDYHINPEYEDGYKRVMDCGRNMMSALDSLHEGKFSVKEYLFANLIRGFIGRVNPKNMERVSRNKFAHLAIAVEMYEDFDKFLNSSKAA